MADVKKCADCGREVGEGSDPLMTAFGSIDYSVLAPDATLEEANALEPVIRCSPCHAKVTA